MRAMPVLAWCVGCDTPSKKEMIMFSSLVQVLKVNEARSGNKNGRDWKMQDAECILLDDKGQPDSVGVLMIPKDLMDKIVVGKYTASFALRPNLSTRKIEAVVTALVAVPAK